jgi:hypothetical protein
MRGVHAAPVLQPLLRWMGPMRCGPLACRQYKHQHLQLMRWFAGHTRWSPGAARNSARGKPQFDQEGEHDAAAKARTRVPQLKHTLRKFYLKVHPDLFGNYPAEKSINETSFALLSSILDINKAVEGTTHGFAGKSVELIFFIMEAAKAEAEADSATPAATPPTTPLTSRVSKAPRDVG